MGYDLRMSRIPQKVLVICLALDSVIPSQAQSSSGLAKQAAAVIQKATHLTPQAPVSVIRFHSEEEFGRFLSCDSETFTFYDVDQKSTSP